jgi:hypothetical protein
MLVSFLGHALGLSFWINRQPLNSEKEAAHLLTN